MEGAWRKHFRIRGGGCRDPKTWPRGSSVRCGISLPTSRTDEASLFFLTIASSTAG
ncbi:hypothetical protein EN817_18935 [Mesorhizobium sp. M3A.F.Ca.ET.174.01.1.1]|nr:hypothetical protein EJ074_13395 [Mesorhizobium sp. M3A.F.Ca.ET.080.04.2.1]RWB75842.1 MAG: hypothetical protein EOQ49_04085 [Mesorhizobium sp.]TGS64001.1 hypothetical protein EN844_23160 [Mesorhizobium sp. M3A.F.Ca.ET.201.01.1.1]TGS86364.1 hypothetical protein EN818_16790 [Mesorhizobium sp. M3A.F.Ca.ET.175.01.1.1]TGT24473.1 hypothetical protein EN817_18935 [Mesorhizobium sp. M3A.F.Ca.ET.174.01.1.1]TGT54326.1 hypothetical protein EN813_044410 [Mesorhizobium sp. M00.F.Ca.ET.170.01.1.1]